MTTDIEEQLSAGMREHVAGVAGPDAVLDRARQSHRRRLAVRRAGFAAGVVTLAGALVAATMLGGGPGPRADTGAPTPAATSPGLSLAAALAASENVSFRFRYTFHVKSRTDALLTADEWQDLNRYGPPGTVTTGAMDPAAATGFLRQERVTGVVYQVRLVNGDLYASKGGAFHRQPGRHTTLGTGLLAGLSGSADPTQLLDLLRQAGSVRQTAPDTYAFTLRIESETNPSYGQSAARDITGEVKVAAGRVARITYEESLTWPDLPPRNLINVYVVELSDYGTKVEVERP